MSRFPSPTSKKGKVRIANKTDQSRGAQQFEIAMLTQLWKKYRPLWSILLYCMLPSLCENLALPGAAKPIVHAGTNRGHLSKNAYVTLLYGDFVLAVRVLGQSLRDTGTKNDLVALCTEAVSESDRIILKSDGWIIRPVSNVDSPYTRVSSRGNYFKGIFTKFLIWNMTEYERIIYLDADVMALANIDHMFDCGTFCAAYRHSDLFNAGILVVEPSARVYKDMLEKIPKIASYDHGDQGFLNVYFKDLMYAPMFNWSDPTRQKKPMRMSGRLNGDMGLYYGHSRWDIPEKELRLIHYTLGPVKPWKWWTLFCGLFELGWAWQDTRRRLYEQMKYKDSYRWWNPLFWAPFPLLIVLFISLKLLSCHFQVLCRSNCITKIVTYCTYLSNVIRTILPLTILLLSYGLSFETVPETVEPSEGEYVFWLWSNFFLVSLSSIIFQLYISRNTSDNDFCLRASIGNKRQLLACSFLYLFSYLVFKVIPPFVHPFSKRAVIFLVLFAVHLLASHIAGTRILKVLVRQTKRMKLTKKAHPMILFCTPNTTI